MENSLWVYQRSLSDFKIFNTSAQFEFRLSKVHICAIRKFFDRIILNLISRAEILSKTGAWNQKSGIGIESFKIVAFYYEF